MFGSRRKCGRPRAAFQRIDVEGTHAKQIKTAIKRKCGEPPEGASLVIRSNPHDFGVYREVAVGFDGDCSEAAAYAYAVEHDAPTTWAEVDMVPPQSTARRTR